LKEKISKMEGRTIIGGCGRDTRGAAAEIREIYHPPVGSYDRRTLNAAVHCSERTNDCSRAVAAREVISKYEGRSGSDKKQ
jgi:hypothetical protein